MEHCFLFLNYFDFILLSPSSCLHLYNPLSIKHLSYFLFLFNSPLFLNNFLTNFIFLEHFDLFRSPIFINSFENLYFSPLIIHSLSLFLHLCLFLISLNLLLILNNLLPILISLIHLFLL